MEGGNLFRVTGTHQMIRSGFVLLEGPEGSGLTTVYHTAQESLRNGASYENVEKATQANRQPGAPQNQSFHCNHSQDPSKHFHPRQLPHDRISSSGETKTGKSQSSISDAGMVVKLAASTMSSDHPNHNQVCATSRQEPRTSARDCAQANTMKLLGPRRFW